MAADANRRGTVSAARAMEPDTLAPPVTPVSIFRCLRWFVVVEKMNEGNRRTIEVFWAFLSFYPVVA